MAQRNLKSYSRVSDSVTRQIEVSINQLIVCFVIAIHGNWIPAIPAGMTDFLVLGESFCCSVSRLKLVAISTKLATSLLTEVAHGSNRVVDSGGFEHNRR